MAFLCAPEIKSAQFSADKLAAGRLQLGCALRQPLDGMVNYSDSIGEFVVSYYFNNSYVKKR